MLNVDQSLLLNPNDRNVMFIKLVVGICEKQRCIIKIRVTSLPLVLKLFKLQNKFNSTVLMENSNSDFSRTDCSFKITLLSKI